MKKSLLALALLGGVFTILYIGINKAETTDLEESGEGPGYFKFIREIKGEIPFNAVNNWAKQASLSKRSGEVLDSIRELGPYNVGGRTRGIVIDKSNINRYFVAAINGGMWVSEESGKNWKAINEKEITLNISHLAQNPLNPDILYYCTGEGAGNSSAAPGAGIFKSTDHGKTFTQLSATANGNFNSAWRIVCSTTDTNTVYVALHSGGVYRSKDGGQSFERVVITSRPVYDLEIFPDGSVMVSIFRQGVYTSTTGDDGSWVLSDSGLPSGSTVGRIELAYCKEQPNWVYAAVSNNSNNALTGFYRSQDQGATWQQRTNPATQGGNYPFTWYCLAMEVKQDDPSSVIIGSVNVVYSTDGGSTWDYAKNSHADYHVMAQHSGDKDLMIIGNDGGVHAYKWSELNRYEDLNWGLNITQYYTGTFAPEGMTIMGGYQDNGTQYTINGNDTFKKAYGADGSYTEISQQEPSLAYLSFQNGRIFRVDGFGGDQLVTKDILNDFDADNNKEVDDGAWFIHPFGINRQDGEMVVYPTKKRVYLSINGGILFDAITDEINIGTNIQPFSVGITNQLNPSVYIGGSNALFYRIKNVRRTKIGQEENLRGFMPKNLYSSFIGCITPNPVNYTELYMSFVNYSSEPRVWKVIKADSDTPEFIDISGNLPVGMPVNWIDVDPAAADSVFFAGTDRGLFYTTDGGQTWFQEDAIPNVVVDMVRVRPSDRRLFIYTHGRGAFTARIKPYGKQIPAYDAVGLKDIEDLRALVYPNPANQQVSIQWDERLGATQEIRIYDGQGRLVLSKVHRNGTSLPTNELKAGVYYIQGTGFKATKLLVQH